MTLPGTGVVGGEFGGGAWTGRLEEGWLGRRRGESDDVETIELGWREIEERHDDPLNNNDIILTM